MDPLEAVRSKLDVREFSNRPVPDSVKLSVLEAARLSPSGVNTQHWRFILVESPDMIRNLAQDSSTGRWVSGANFAVIVCTDPSKSYHLLDAGRAVQNMELAAWGLGVASGIYTGIKQPEMRRDFGIPEGLSATVVVGFGYPVRKILGRKNRLSLSEVTFLERFGVPLRDFEGDNHMKNQ
jgi:nitroreductase